MRVLFIKPHLSWPRASGHDIYCYFMMQTMAALGTEVSLATVAPIDAKAVEGVQLAYAGQLPEELPAGAPPVELSWAQERFRSFWGVSRGHIAGIRDLSNRLEADVVIAVGLPALPFLAGPERALRIWAMADEWVYHHVSLVRATEPSTWHNLKIAAIKGAYERAYASRVDRAWAVSITDQRAGRWLAGMPVVDFVPLGVDTAFYHPRSVVEQPNTCVFWGRLDFEPNIDAVVWFCERVWPSIRRLVPDARFTIIGYNPIPRILQLAELPGVVVQPNVDDLRSAVCVHALVVLPMISGGGIKNKLLEGAAMARPIVCTPRACMDLLPPDALPLAQARTPTKFADCVVELWKDPLRRSDLGTRARIWVGQYYSWEAAVRRAFAGFRRSGRPFVEQDGLAELPRAD